MTTEGKDRSSFTALKSLDERDRHDLRCEAYPWTPSGRPSEADIEAAMQRYLEYRKQWSECTREYRETAFPTNVDIELSSKCNLRCAMCHWGLDDNLNPRPTLLTQFQQFKQHTGVMSLEFFKQLVDEIAREQGFAIKLGWRGEPLMNKDLVAMVRYAKEQGIPEVLVNTNGELLSPEKSHTLIDAGLDIIIVSIDSLIKERFESIREGASFVNILSNLLLLVKTRDAHRARTGWPKPIIRVQMVLMDENREEVPFFHSFFKGIADVVAVKEYNNRGESTERLTRQDRPVGRKPCPQLWQRMQVAWDGQVAMCCQDWDMYNPFGRIHYPESTIKHVWAGLKRQQAKQAHLRAELDLIPGCNACTYIESYKWEEV